MSVRKKLRVLFADDEPHLQELMRMELPRMGHEVVVCPDGAAAIAALERGPYDAAILDLRMPGADGLEVMPRLKQLSPETEVIILTGHATLETAIEALRQGAFDYLTKPCKLVELESLLARVAEKRALTHRALALETRLRAAEGTPEIVGSSPAIARVKELIHTIGPTPSTVLILGETGTGKELVARTLHQLSPRASAPFVAVNCGALPENLVESELFGHRKGAFTGADQNRKGLFEVADGGTLFLDEVGELPPAIQVKLLRFLEAGEIRRVGDNEPFSVDVRIVCATNRELAQMVEEGGFREDLYFRINTFEIGLPALREHKQDIPELAQHLLHRFVQAGRIHPRLLDNTKGETGSPKEFISEDALEVLLSHDWPGNVRELANVLEHAAILSGGGRIESAHLPQQLDRAPRRPAAGTAGPHVAFSTSKTLREIELEVIQQVLAKHNGHKPAAARELGISLKTLYNKLHQMQEA